MKTLNYFKIYILLLIPVFICEGQEPTSVQKTKPQKGNTEITGDEFEMVSREKETYFLFTGNVEIRATNMVATCNRLEVYTSKTDPPKTDDKQKPKEEKASIGKIEKIVAIGNVRLVQKERVATAGKAEILPQTGKVVLMDSPKVTSKDGVLVGYRITLLQGEQKALIEKGPGQRPTLILPRIPDLGIGVKQKPMIKP
jgi:lipopolysaccharide export system protein LptA